MGSYRKRRPLIGSYRKKWPVIGQLPKELPAPAEPDWSPVSPVTWRGRETISGESEKARKNSEKAKRRLLAYVSPYCSSFMRQSLLRLPFGRAIEKE